MTEPLLFQGPFFDHLMTQAPLAGTRYFSHGSFSLLFEDDTRLFRLTRDGGGHVFLVKESAVGNPHVVKVLKDYGPVAPSDEDRQIGFYYWLAEVERLQELPAEDERTLRLEQALDLMEYDSADLAEQIEEASKAFPEFQSLFQTLELARRFAHACGDLPDPSISNVMLRPSTGEWVWVDALTSTEYLPDEATLLRLEAMRAGN